MLVFTRAALSVASAKDNWRVFGSPDFAARPCQAARRGQKDGMDFDDQLRRYFGTADLTAIHREAHAAGTERMRVDFGLETNPGRRFALWALMYMLGVAPDLDVAFKDEGERNTARDFMDMVDKSSEDDGG
jgi:hypothetical protein